MSEILCYNCKGSNEAVYPCREGGRLTEDGVWWVDIN